MMSTGAQAYNIAAIRQLLLAAFTPEELRRFCYDRPAFRPIVDLFGPGLGAVDMVDRVVEYCDRRVLLDQLLAEVNQINPGQYARFEPDLLITKKEPPAEMPAKPIVKKPPKGGLAELMFEIPTVLDPLPLCLVRVPAGEFVMGGVLTKDRQVAQDELPPHRVYLPEFRIGKYPVTNLQYQAFVQATGRQVPDHWEGLGALPPGKEDHPVVRVAWGEARAFCAWLSQETGQPFRLPTEAEWEKAARGTDGRIYPWGDELPDKDRCNFGKNIGDSGTTTVGHYSPQGDSPYGCADMAGNVWEWCQSIYSPYPYQADDGREDLEYYEALEITPGRVIRGGAWYCGPADVRCSRRYGQNPSIRHDDGGFRVVQGEASQDASFSSRG